MKLSEASSPHSFSLLKERLVPAICRVRNSATAIHQSEMSRSVNFAKVWTDLPLFAKSDDEFHGADLQDCHRWPVWQILVALCIRGKVRLSDALCLGNILPADFATITHALL